MKTDLLLNLVVPALLSGKYKQTSGVLHRSSQIDGEETFCCLGVMTDLAIKNNLVEGRWSESDRSIWSRTLEFWGSESEGEREYLPVEIQEAFGLEDKGGFEVTEVSDHGGTTYRATLDNLNDNGRSFMYIAGAILQEIARREAEKEERRELEG